MGFWDDLREKAEQQSMLDHDEPGNPLNPSHSFVNENREWDVDRFRNVGTAMPTLPEPETEGFSGVGHGFTSDAADSLNVDLPSLDHLGLYAKALVLLAVVYVLGQLFNVNVGGGS